ncbi:MAG: hypothetical protein H6600_09090 [Flavobacteriales bacterium]|nr:hypothetical protein [Flavobacteriales bacterium]
MKKIPLLLLVPVLMVVSSCNRKGCTDDQALNYDENAKKDDGSCEFATTPPIDTTMNVEGYGILNKLPGIWNGPVNSQTALGTFSEWIVDFRPISSSQISAKNELDSVNDIFMSFFICKYENAYKLAFRNGGGFAGNVRNSYMVIDSVSETSGQSFYRFSDPVSGGDRVYTEITFKDDSLIMHTYTNQYNTLTEPVTHFIWKADKRDDTSTQDAIAAFDFPQKELTRDFSSTFDGLSEAVFYSASLDPYPENEQPYLGVSNVTINISNPTTVDPTKKVLIIITTQPLFNGFTFNAGNLDYRSRYVLVGAESTTGYGFNYMHPGTYYLNAIYDENGDFGFSTGDYMNSQFDKSFTLSAEGTSQVNLTIDFQIP